MEFKSKNPVLNKIESTVETNNYSYVTGETATFSGIATKTGILLSIIFGISLIIWTNLSTFADYLPGMMIGGMIVGFISVIAAGVSRNASPFFTILYAISEGLVLGTVSAIVNTALPGIVADAVLITFAIFAFLLIAYSTGLFKVGFRFRKIFYTALFGVCIFYFFYFILSFFNIPLLQVQNPGILIALTLGMVILASFSLLIDFDNCKLAVKDGVPKRSEWYLSLGLLVSLVWLYIEVLRLLIIISSYFRD
ncbi:Bax inhibitor-1/YccA family protein [Mycoplasmatota bacterium]|nr:Bax inhibitor-1/YccA family protein [Mycoplasmatota bacterium]